MSVVVLALWFFVFDPYFPIFADRLGATVYAIKKPEPRQ